MNDVLFEEWRAYEKLVENDYMGHVQFFRLLEEEVRRRFQTSVAILDLGCGDASPIRNVLRRLDVRRYCGVDDSTKALAKAEINLASLDIPYRLYSGDLIGVLRRLPGRFDVVVASYSFHHIDSRATKEQALRECLRVLSPGGVVVVIDVFLREGESREAYLHRWESNARARFAALNEEEMATLIDHVWGCDFPESLSAFEGIAGQAGYDRVVPLADDGLNRLVALETSTTRGLQ